jgi:hypothetical protein
MRKVVATMLAAVAIAAGLSLVQAPAAQAAGCVTKPEARATHWKMRRDRVEAIFDATPRLADRWRRGGHRYVGYDYKRCTRGWVAVSYRRSRGVWRTDNQYNIRRHRCYVCG